MRKVHLILTIGGGSVGVVVTLRALFAIQEPNPMAYALMSVFAALYAYGVFAGLRLVERPQEKKHAAIYYWVQVPWISSPLLAYRFSSGAHITAGIEGMSFRVFFLLGSDWQFSLLRPAPWSIGVNAVALVMAILLMSQNPNGTPDPIAATSTGTDRCSAL